MTSSERSRKIASVGGILIAVGILVGGGSCATFIASLDFHDGGEEALGVSAALVFFWSVAVLVAGFAFLIWAGVSRRRGQSRGFSSPRAFVMALLLPALALMLVVLVALFPNGRYWVVAILAAALAAGSFLFFRLASAARRDAGNGGDPDTNHTDADPGSAAGYS